jgi:putative transposase
MLGAPGANRSFLVVETQKGPSMRYLDSIFGNLLKPIDRRQFRAIVAHHDGDAYDKSFKSWDHLVTLIFAQLSHADTLRGLELAFNVNAQHHYHLNVDKLSRATLSDANKRRPVGVFADTFTMLSQRADRTIRREGAQMIRLIDASPVPLGKLCRWATWNGRIRGMKMHVAYDPDADRPHRIEITPATINDIEIGQKLAIEAGATYVFDKGYCQFAWWQKINDDGAFFVTRPKVNCRLRCKRRRPLRRRRADGFRILDDHDVVLASRSNARPRPTIPLRRIRVRRDKGAVMTLITNDRSRPAIEIAALYKRRWQIELLFRWIKQHLRIRKFLGNNDNAIRLQILAAMIAYLLLRITARLNSLRLPALRLAELVCQFLFDRRPIAKIDKSPPANPTGARPTFSPDQLQFRYA